MTGIKPRGKWYLLYGPGMANLGSVGKLVMFVDFANPENKDFESVINWFPHELNHLIYESSVGNQERSVLSHCLNEGFAVYVNELYWRNKGDQPDYSTAMSLAYSDDELTQAVKEWDYISAYFLERYKSKDKEVIDQFGTRNHRIKKELPGAIGYFIGYKIVDSYVQLHGTDSWKDIYHLSPEVVLTRSGLFDLK